MNYEEFMKAIGFSEETVAVVEGISVSEAEIAALPQAPFLHSSYAGDRPDQVLALFVHYLAEYSERPYHARGSTRAEWLNTMRDLKLWSDHLLCERGEVGLRETAWLAHLVRTEIFRLGRLQFVPRLSECEITFDGHTFPAGTSYCEVHIPAGGKLLPAEADASFMRAKTLFAPRFFSCDSWLLSPKLGKFLSEGNILAFAARFTVVETNEKSRSAERYIFGTIGDPQEYTAANPFSARVKEGACEGEFVGSALGYMLA